MLRAPAAGFPSRNSFLNLSQAPRVLLSHFARYVHFGAPTREFVRSLLQTALFRLDAQTFLISAPIGFGLGAASRFFFTLGQRFLFDDTFRFFPFCSLA